MEKNDELAKCTRAATSLSETSAVYVQVIDQNQLQSKGHTAQYGLTRESRLRQKCPHTQSPEDRTLGQGAVLEASAMRTTGPKRSARVQTGRGSTDQHCLVEGYPRARASSIDSEIVSQATAVSMPTGVGSGEFSQRRNTRKQVFRLIASSDFKLQYKELQGMHVLIAENSGCRDTILGRDTPAPQSPTLLTITSTRVSSPAAGLQLSPRNSATGTDTDEAPGSSTKGLSPP
jgi:hypothetical protein